MFKSMFWFKRQDEPIIPVIAEYIWIDGNGLNIRSKSRTLDINEVQSLKDIPCWSFDGSSTNQATVDKSEIVLKPVYYCKDPFRQNPNAILVLCSTWQWSIDEGPEIRSDFFTGLNQTNLNQQYLQPAIANFRTPSEAIWSYVEDDEICFGIEQEYLIEDKKNEFDAQQIERPQYCAQGEQMKVGRKVSETHYQYCLYAGLNIHGTNSEVMFNQWEYQIGICNGIEVCDQLWLSRYILYRVAEQFGVNINLQPNPNIKLPDLSISIQQLDQMTEKICGNGAHVNFSTALTRLEARKAQQQKPNNLGPILQQMINDLGSTHQQYIQYFGKDNKLRLTGTNETSNYDSFSYGLDSRNVSVRIPTKPIKQGMTTYRTIQGYLEDRRPGANMDPYIVCSLIAQSVLAPKLPQLSGGILQAFDQIK